MSNKFSVAFTSVKFDRNNNDPAIITSPVEFKILEKFIGIAFKKIDTVMVKNDFESYEVRVKLIDVDEILSKDENLFSLERIDKDVIQKIIPFKIRVQFHFYKMYYPVTDFPEQIQRARKFKECTAFLATEIEAAYLSAK